MVLTATQYRRQTSEVDLLKHFDNYCRYDFGWSRGRYTNKAAGIRIGMHKHMDPKNVTAIEDCPCETRGQGGAIRYKDSADDILVGGIYFFRL